MPLKTSGRQLHGVLQPRGFPGLPEGWVTDWETFAASDGKLQLFGALHHVEPWTAEKKGHRALLVLHGFGEHGGRYLHFPHFLQGHVGTVYFPELRGHGRSEGLRGHIADFDLFVKDAAFLIRRLDEKLKERFKKSEIHILGHSMGGHIALRAVFQDPELPLRSVTISAPFLGVKGRVPVSKRLAAYVLSNTWGTLQIPTGMDVEGLSRDPEVVENYRNDRLNHSKMTPRFYTSMVRAWNDTLKRESGIHYPIQFLVPQADRVVDADRAISFFKRLKHRDKRLKTYPDFFHEPFNEREKEQAFADLISWIDAHGEEAFEAPQLKSEERK